MMKRFLLLAVLLPTGLCLSYVGDYGSNMVVSGDRYTMLIPPDLNDSITFNSWAKVTLNPSIIINGDEHAVELKPSRENFQQGKTSVTVSTSLSGEYVKANANIRFSESSAESVLELTGLTDVEATVSYQFNFDKPVRIFSVPTYKNSTDRVFAFIPLDYDGDALVVTTNWDLSPEIIKSNNVRVNSFLLSTRVLLKTNAKTTLRLRVKPFTLVQNQRKNYPLEYEGFLSNKLVKTTGKVDMSIPDAPGRITELISRLGGKGGREVEFVSFHDVDMTKIGGDSLTLSCIGKQVCINSGIPCKIVVGKNTEGKYYAWLDVFDGAWQAVDLVNGLREQPAGYEKVYEEPAGEFYVVPVEPSDNELYSAIIAAAAEEPSHLIYYVLAGAGLFTVIVLFFKYKAEAVISRTKEKPKAITVNIDGLYEVAGGDVNHPLLQEVIEKIKQKQGRVSVEEYAKEMHYSKELVDWAVRDLIQQGIIKKKQ